MSVLLLLLLLLTQGNRPEQLGQALCVYKAQQGTSPSNRTEGIGESQTGPAHRDRATLRIRGSVEEDARLAPGLTLADELKGATGQRMERVVTVNTCVLFRLLGTVDHSLARANGGTCQSDPGAQAPDVRPR